MNVDWRNIPIALKMPSPGEETAQAGEKVWLRQLSRDGLESVLHSARMLSLDDNRWDGLTGATKVHLTRALSLPNLRLSRTL